MRKSARSPQGCTGKVRVDLGLRKKELRGTCPTLLPDTLTSRMQAVATSFLQTWVQRKAELFLICLPGLLVWGALGQNPGWKLTKEAREAECLRKRTWTSDSAQLGVKSLTFKPVPHTRKITDNTSDSSSDPLWKWIQVKSYSGHLTVPQPCWAADNHTLSQILPGYYSSSTTEKIIIF